MTPLAFHWKTNFPRTGTPYILSGADFPSVTAPLSDQAAAKFDLHALFGIKPPGMKGYKTPSD